MSNNVQIYIEQHNNIDPHFESYMSDECSVLIDYLA